MNNASFYLSDPWLEPFRDIIDRRIAKCVSKEAELAVEGSLLNFALGHYYYGLHRNPDHWVFREWAPNATNIYLTGIFSGWKEKEEFRMNRINIQGDWEIMIPVETLHNGDLYKLSVIWEGGKGERIPSYANRVVQDEVTKIFSAQVWQQEPYKWTIENFKAFDTAPLIYEAHVGMGTSDEKTGTYREFMETVLPIIIKSGYNTIQFMAVQEHPFYGSFGYHVSSFFAASSRFGTPEELKELVDRAHQAGIRVIMDLVHSHSVKNVNEGLGLFDGSPGQYFHSNPERRNHRAWDSLCFDYGKVNVIHFLLSNCRYWLEEYKFDGFRFDGITSMIYFDHGLEKNFTSYFEYYDGNQDEDALTYLYLANKLIHSYKPGALAIAEEMSGMPGIAASTESMGYGFDYRLSMGVPDFWIKLVKETSDENWDIGKLMYELTQHRPEEKIISYCELHDQALVGDKTLIFRMIDAEMYYGMQNSYHSITVDRGIALHKMIRLITFSTTGGGYLNFMGNEFGHPEWIDFPREGNNWSYKFARRLWHLAENPSLKYFNLAEFDKAMVNLHHSYKILDHPYVYRVYENNTDKVTSFMRGDLLFVFNFHPTLSFTDYGIPVQGRFKIVVDTDDPHFGGFDRIDRSSIYLSVRKAERNIINAPLYLYLYLPSRTALVFKKEAVRNAYDL